MRAKQNLFRLMIAAGKYAGLVLSLLICACPVFAAQSLYENDAVVTDPTPIPDATNFLNTGTFTVSVPPLGPYETRDTLNYTNIGFMQGFFGFEFDNFNTTTSVRGPAAIFDNENTIESGVQLMIWATNILNPGYLTVDKNVGGMEFSGNNVDLSNGTLLLQGGLGFGGANGQGSDYGIGTDTNGDWNPGADLTGTFALSSLFSTVKTPFLVQNLLLEGTGLTSYFHEDAIGTNLVIIQAVFVQDNNPAPQITHNVYFDGIDMTVEWLGIYTNNATGIIGTNYLYLDDEARLINSNGFNIVKANVNTLTPDNYKFSGSATQKQLGAATDEGFQPVFPTVNITNNYSYLNAQLIATTVGTNTLVNTNVSAIGGRIQITATNEMNLNNISIQGVNYLSLTSTNQFDGNNGAIITAPFSDLNLAVTNGNLVVSNLLQPNVPVWGGTVQAWSSRWIMLVSNFVGTNLVAVTNDFRVELVEDDVVPTSPAQVQNLTLTGTNSVIICDALNIFGSILINAQSLTLTTNGIGNGAASEQGELNIQNNDNVFVPGSLPYLHWLTNNGLINIGNLAQFGAAAPTMVTNITPFVPGVAAFGVLSEIAGRTNILNTNHITIGTNTFVFVKKVVNNIPYQVLMGKTFDASMSNLIAAINHNTTKAWTNTYSAKTPTNVFVSAGPLTNHAFAVTALTPGVAGDLIVTTTTSTNLMWSGLTLAGGTNSVASTTNIVSLSGPYGTFINNGSLSDQGVQIYANYFEDGGFINNGQGSFTLSANTAVFTNGEVLTISGFEPFLFFTTNSQNSGFNGNINITADTLIISNSILAAGGGFIFNVTNLLTDTGVTNNNFLFSDGGSLTGLNLARKPVAGDILGTTVEMITPGPNKAVKNVWSGVDYGVSVNGYNNNVAIGQLILDIPTANSSLNFSGIGASNAMYVDRLVLEDYASYTNGLGTAQIPTLTFNTNLVIYYANAVASGQDVSYQLNNSNHGHLRWVPQYTGFFSSTNVVYANGSTNTVNIGLLSSPFLDSNGNGIPNANDPNPIFVPSQVNFKFSLTNLPPMMAVLTWDSIPSATNTIFYTTNMIQMNWTVVTNFVSPTNVPPVGGWPITNLVIEPLHMMDPHGFYRVGVIPNSGTAYGQ